MDCGRPIDKAPVIFPSKLLQDFGSKEKMFSGHLEDKPSDNGKSSSLQSVKTNVVLICMSPFGIHKMLYSTAYGIIFVGAFFLVVLGRFYFFVFFSGKI